MSMALGLHILMIQMSVGGHSSIAFISMMIISKVESDTVCPKPY